MNKSISQFFVLILLLAALSPHAALTQTLQNLTLAINPPFPKAEEEVQAKAILVGADQDLSSFEWYKDGKQDKSASGKGKNVFIFKVGNGPRTIIDAVVMTPDGNRLSATRAITRERPVIIWSANTSVPLWYKGKPLPSPGSTVTIMALPGAGFGESASELFYSWNINLEPHPEVSGIGKNKFTLKTSLVPDVSQQIIVRISNANQTIAQEATLILPTRSTELLVYRLTPAGLTDFSKTISEFGGTAGGIFDFIATPFYFRQDLAFPPVFVWSVSGQASPSGDKPNILSIKTNSGESSESAVSISASAGKGIEKQEAEYLFRARFR
ncbi:MAG: hypothetical protein HYW90_02330 [Candidatus Sungbacteria bacterium]|nr:hypothetical protein [Candidatus Sungbacteria bacterium]